MPMSRTILWPLLALGLWVCPTAADDAQGGAQRLAWLAGHWISEQDGRWTEESWTPPRGGLLLGVNRSGSGNRAGAFEFLRIAEDADGTLAYWASPSGAPPTRFVLAELTDQRVAFENPANDYPVRIEYRRDGDRLTATISGAGGIDPMQWTFAPAGTVPAPASASSAIPQGR